MVAAPRGLLRTVTVLLAAAGSPAAANQGLAVRDATLGSGAFTVGAGVDPLGVSANYLITPDLGEQHGANLRA